MPGMLQWVIARDGEEASVKHAGRPRGAALLYNLPLALLLAACADKPGGPIPYR